jgi:hypothetical protein
MFVDGQLQFSSAQAITAAANSTNSIDLSIARNIGEGKVLYITTAVTTALTDGGSNTGTQVILYGGTTAGSTTALQDLYVIPQAAAVGSGPYFAQIYPGLITSLPAYYEFLMLNYAPQTANLTGGAFTSYVVTDIQAFVAYKRGYTIS